MPLPSVLYLIRHGETEWNRQGRLTGREDLPMTAEGETAALRLAPIVAPLDLAVVRVSPLQRARRTCELAGLGPRAEIDPDLVEWDYGMYSGQRMVDLQRCGQPPDVFTEGCPSGEDLAAVATRAQAVLGRLASVDGAAALVGHGHQLRVLACLWLSIDPTQARSLLFDNACYSILARRRGVPVLHRWNVAP